MKRIKIKNSYWKVKFKKSLSLDGVDCFGLCDFDNKTILLASNQDERELKLTLLHEALHACLHMHNLRPECLDKEEAFVHEYEKLIKKVIFNT